MPDQSLLISPDDLVDLELITKDDLYPIPEFDAAKVDYGAVLNYKNGLFKRLSRPSITHRTNSCWKSSMISVWKTKMAELIMPYLWHVKMLMRENPGRNGMTR